MDQQALEPTLHWNFSKISCALIFSVYSPIIQRIYHKTKIKEYSLKNCQTLLCNPYLKNCI